MANFFAEAVGAPRGPQNNIFLDWRRMVDDAQASPNAWSEPEAFAAVLFCAATCDGAVNAIEHETLLAIVHRSRALKALNADQLGALNERVLERLRGGRETALEQAASALPAPARLPTFAHALDIVLSDGELSKEEASFLNALAAHLGLERTEIEQVAAVLVMKNAY